MVSEGGAELVAGQEVDDAFTGLPDAEGWMLVAGFGSLLSERSSRLTFPGLRNFRTGRIKGWRRVFAHTAAIFFRRGIARPDTGEISSLSCEAHPEAETVVALFEVHLGDEQAVKDFVEREHEFRFVAVEAEELDGSPCRQLALICARFSDEEYKAKRCPPHEWQQRYVQYGVERVWRDDVLPCRVYLRHCVLSAQSLSPVAYENFLDQTFLADRTTTIRQHLAEEPGIMDELPPPELADRYSGSQT
eukprot:jgi/Tetstr1/431352/TSEL_021043.t1